MFWSLKTDDPALLAGFSPDDADEFILALDPAAPEEILARAAAFPQEKIRLALPMVVRASAGDDTRLRAKIKTLGEAGFEKWEISQLGQLSLLPARADVSADWPLYVLNTAAAAMLFSQGLSRLTASPEDERENLKTLLAALGEKLQVILYQDTPLFTGEGCPKSSLQKNAPRCACSGAPFTLENRHGQEYFGVSRACRTTVISAQPFSLGQFQEELVAAGMRSARADFINRKYSPAAAREVWAALKAGESPENTHSGNYLRGLQ